MRALQIARITVLVALVAAGTALLPMARDPLPVNHAFLPAFLALIIAADLLSCVLLAMQFLAGGRPSLLGLATAYLYGALIVIPYALSFPGLAATTGPLIGDLSSASWLWSAWNTGFPVLLAAAVGLPAAFPARVERVTRQRVRWLAASAVGVVVLVLAVTYMTVVEVERLPTILVAGSYASLTRIAGPWIIGVNVLALGVVTVAVRHGPNLERWVLIASVASALDVVLTLVAKARFTVGWYGARSASLIAASLVLIALMTELNGLYRHLAVRHAELRARSLRDPLTGVLTRVATLAGAEGVRDDAPMSIGLLDLDHFKSVNDTYGHAVGDEVLVEVTRRMTAALRERDLVGRYGGEEFIVVLPTCDIGVATTVAGRALERLRGEPILTGAGALRVTASIGVAELREGEELTAALQRADRALYAAKAAGRDRAGVDTPSGVVLQGPGFPLPDSLPTSNVTTQ